MDEGKSIRAIRPVLYRDVMVLYDDHDVALFLLSFFFIISLRGFNHAAVAKYLSDVITLFAYYNVTLRSIVPTDFF